MSKTTYPFRFKSFRSALICLAIFVLIFEVMFGFLRTPVADHYVGEVYLASNVPGRSIPQLTKLDATLDLDVLDKGVVYGRIPRIYDDGLRIVFSGPDAAKLKAAGIPERFIATEEHSDFARSYCFIAQGSRAYDNPNTSRLNPGDSVDIARSVKGEAVNLDNPRGNCVGMTLRFQSADELEFYIQDFNKSAAIKTKLRRKTTYSPIQSWIMRSRDWRVASWNDSLI
ncbi:hypothetical protein ACYPKM_01120 [Pseudomonas aeruginosa]